MSYQLLTQTLIESFNALADEVQALTDRKTILEHKLRYAHEQFQFLADKHAPSDTSISETLANLQIPPEPHAPSLTDAVRVPLPSRARSPQDSRHKTALVIRDGRRVSQQLAALVEASKTSSSSRDVFSRRSHSPSSMPTDMEQDFTVEGKKGSLACPFSRPAPAQNGRVAVDGNEAGAGVDADGNNPANDPDPTPHHSTDPICAAMFEETTHMPAPPTDAGAPKCPIRYMGEHSPEEIAHYVETHKHEIPRSHEICVARYQRNEEEIRKLDAKYGNIVSMIQVLSQLHKPMLPSAESANEDTRRQRDRDLDKASNERVESWAQEVSASAPQMEDVEKAGGGAAAQAATINGDNASDRVGRFDRALKEIRVGESPTRPWGISVPVGQPYDEEKGGPPLSPPAAPVVTMGTVPVAEAPTRKCPFDHTKFMPSQAPDSTKAAAPSSMQDGPTLSPPPQTAFSHHAMPAPPSMHNPSGYSPSASNKPFTQPQSSALPPQPAFINPPPPASHSHPGQPAAAKQGFPPTQGAPQMVFTGPVFIGYPFEQAMQIMNQWRGGG
jgi:hypothetical protein